MAKNNESYGACSPKSGDNLTPLCRKSGFNKTMTSLGGSTRSRHKGTDKHNQWETVVSHETGGNTKGWNPE